MAPTETACYHFDDKSCKNFSVCAVSYDSILKELKKNQNGFLSFKRILT